MKIKKIAEIEIKTNTGDAEVLAAELVELGYVVEQPYGQIIHLHQKHDGINFIQKKTKS